jgi:hypothetical protein
MQASFRQRMKILASLLVVAAIATLVAWEAMWRFDHALPEDSITSPQGDHVAQERALPEDSELPYGQGVFVRRAYVPLWATSKLVFAGHCKPDLRVAWSAARQLTVACVVAEGEVLMPPPPAGITVVHDNLAIPAHQPIGYSEFRLPPLSADHKR